MLLGAVSSKIEVGANGNGYHTILANVGKIY
jgi:hypothetical protein